MGQISTRLLNKTIRDNNIDQTPSNTDSLSLQLVGMVPGAFVEIAGISWGGILSSGITLDTAIRGVLQVIRNEVFDLNTVYTNNMDKRDVVFESHVDRSAPFKDLDFATPLRLNDSPNYLIIVAGLFNSDLIPPSVWQGALTVRGRVIEGRGPRFR